MSVGYVATINVPGYLPMDDDPPVFDTVGEAWAYLADERERGEEDAGDPEPSETLRSLRELAEINDRPGVLYGPTPGYDGEHDLGLAYCVSPTEEDGCE